MAAEGRSPYPGVSQSPIHEALREDSCSFEFFQAVTLLQRLREGCQPVGTFSNPQDEAVRFRVHNRLPFPASQIQELHWSENDTQPEMLVNFMGLTGASGVLPYCYTELILERLKAKDRSLEAFLDIFNHRVLSFFYRAWSKYRFPVSYQLGNQDWFTRYLLDLVGLGTPGLQQRMAVPDEAILNYVSLFAEQSRSAAALESILADYFEVPVEVEQFTGNWYSLDEDTQCSLHEDAEESRQLGGGAVVGDAVWDRQGSVRIKIGPVGLTRYCDFLPDGTAFEPLKAITKLFSNGEFDFELQLILDRNEVPPCPLSTQHEQQPRLGWVTWLKQKPMEKDPGDTILKL